MRRGKQKRKLTVEYESPPIRLKAFAEKHGMSLRALMRYVPRNGRPSETDPALKAYRVGQAWFAQLTDILDWERRCARMPPKKPQGIA